MSAKIEPASQIVPLKNHPYDLTELEEIQIDDGIQLYNLADLTK